MTSELVPDTLSRWLTANIQGIRPPLTMTKFPGGQSNPTFRVDAANGSYVLRRKPLGSLLESAHAVDREHRFISALHPSGFPVPRPYALCLEEGVAGAIFYVMEMVEGRIFWDGALPDLDASSRPPLYESMIDTLARLHCVDIEAVGLQDFRRPESHLARQLARWTKQYRATQTDHQAQMEGLMAWLPGSVPEQSRTTIVHGDYRLDNLIFAGDQPRVICVLDWELATIGDPLTDLAYLALNWVIPHAPGQPGLGGLDLEALGIPSLHTAIERYCAACRVDEMPVLDWYFAYNLFRLAAIVQGIKRRLLSGNASNANAAATVSKLPELTRAAWDFARRAGLPASSSG